jgi:hypothetical protein
MKKRRGELRYGLDTVAWHGVEILAVSRERALLLIRASH